MEKAKVVVDVDGVSGADCYLEGDDLPQKASALFHLEANHRPEWSKT